jgi:hypothetical protein
MMNGNNNLNFCSMRNKIILILITYCFGFFLLNGCQEVEDLTPPVSREGINSITAYFYGDDNPDNKFTSEIDHENGIITIVFPYNYPRNSDNILTMEDLTHLRVEANLDDNVIISPPLLYMDFTKENYITVIDQTKTKKVYKVVAEIRKSSECKILSFELPSLGITGIIDENNKTISLISIEPIGAALANVRISHGATISPDPSKEALDYDVLQQITVTAQDGKTISVYTIKKDVPKKTDFGIRSNSAKILWSKKINTELGIPELNLTTGIAVTKDFVVLNTRNRPSIYLDRKTGEIKGTINMDGIIGSLVNFYNTADDNDNILICNLYPNVKPFKIWKIKGVTGTPELYIEWDGNRPIGRKFSIKGNIDGDAIISAAILDAANEFARWQVKDGVLQSQIPEIIKIDGLEGSWGNNCDVVYTDPSDLNSDYFVAYYAPPRKFAWIDGKTNTVKAWGPEINANWISNAADYTVFNNCPYAVQNSVNSFTWGSDDTVYLYDVSSTSTFGTPVWSAPKGTYGGKDNAGANANGTGDVALKVSDDGYYMYLYFMFTNGCVVCVQFDCIDM